MDEFEQFELEQAKINSQKPKRSTFEKHEMEKEKV